jgi:hypothetical protein
VINGHPSAINHYRHVLKQWVGARPAWYFPIVRLRGNHGDQLIRRDTDICIEGYPRSANSFAVGAFTHAQPGAVHVAHHAHVPAQLLRAVRWSIPALALVRPPDDAVVSRRALSMEIAAVNDEPFTPRLTWQDLLQEWITFYESVQPHRERIVVGAFDDVVTAFDAVIERVNRRFGTSFSAFEHTEADVAAVHAGRGYHAGPSERRDRLKEEARVSYAEARQQPVMDLLHHRAEALYHTLVTPHE